MNFAFKNPDYLPVFAAHTERLKRLRTVPGALAAAKLHYKDHPADFISDFGMTFDPRNVERNLPTTIPFILFPRQRQWIDWCLDRWRNQEPGLTEKCRESGMSWLTVCLATTLCLFHHGMVIGFGSRKEIYVDEIGSPKSLFEKARFFLSHLPAEFLDGWTRERHAPHMRILFPGTGSAMTGEAGDGIGRGDRTSIYFVDEAAFLERPQLIDSSLSATTNCRQDISTPNGMANPFAQKRFAGNIKVFTFGRLDDPRKGDAWYAKQVRELSPTVVAQEIDINYQASIEGALIPSAWIQAAIGAHLKLGITPTGSKYAGLDVADEGHDKNAFAGRHGFLLEYLKSWSGKGSDIFKSVVRSFAICDEMGYDMFFFDGDGLGAGVRGDACQINELRQRAGKRQILDVPFRGSGAVSDPNGEMVPKRKNLDFFANSKAQAWWALRLRFQATHRAIVERTPFDADAIISIDPQLEELTALTVELSQPTYSINTVGKIVIDKAPDGMRSPNLADAVMICFNPSRRALEIWARCAG